MRSNHHKHLIHALVLCCLLGALAGQATVAQHPEWIWAPGPAPGRMPPGACHFRKSFKLDGVQAGHLEIAADDVFEAYVNGSLVSRDGGSTQLKKYDIGRYLREGSNTIAVKVVNRDSGAAGLVARIQVRQKGKRPTQVVTDTSWKTSRSPIALWHLNRYSDKQWVDAQSLGPLGKSPPWIAKHGHGRSPVSGAAQLANRNRLASSPTDLDPNSAAASGHGSSIRASSQSPTIITASNRTVRTVSAVADGDANPQQDIAETQKPSSARFQPLPGFQVEHVLGNNATGSLIAMTINEFGQIIASQENGPLLLIYDSNRDQRIDKVRTYCSLVTNCQGLLALSGDVFAVGEGPEGNGLYRLRDADNDGVLEKANTLVRFETTAVEHGPHGIVLGPEGKLYIVVGNHSAPRKAYAASSPLRHYYAGDLVPRQEDPGGHARGVKVPGGVILRTDVNGSQLELFAGGLRNAYDLAFNSRGDLFTYDSDMESDLGANWYRPTRLYHVLPGAEFGWRSGWAKWPDYYLDSLPPVVETGRGSPTGMVFYDHTVYPDKYRGALFLCDWSEGRILAARLNPEGASYQTNVEVFLKGEPLNVTDIEVGPDGHLYFVTGGRGTQGGLYRIAWNAAKPQSPPASTVRAAAASPQLQSAWGRQRVARIQRDLGEPWQRDIRSACLDRSLSPAQRMQALQAMNWMGPIPDAALLMQASRDSNAEMRSMATSLMGNLSRPGVRERLLELLKDRDPNVRREACESLADLAYHVRLEALTPALASPDRQLAWSARRLLESVDVSEWQDAALDTQDQRLFLQAATAMMIAAPSKPRALQVSRRALEFMGGFVNDRNFIDMLRLLQLAVLRGNLQPEDLPELPAALAEEFPSTHDIINRELVRLLVRLQVTSPLDRYFAHLDSDIPMAERIHLATHMTFLQSGWTTQQKLRLFHFLEIPDGVGNSVPGYLQNVAHNFGGQLRPNESEQVLQLGEQFPSASLAAILRLPSRLSDEQIQTLSDLDRKLSGEGEIQRRLRVAIVAVLARDGQDASLAYLREVYDRDPQRRIEVALGLAQYPSLENWEYLVRSLNLVDGPTARDILTKLRGIPRAPKQPEPYRQVIIVGQQLGDEGGDDAVRVLEHWQGFAHSKETPSWEKALTAWIAWFAEEFPEQPLPQLSTGGVHNKWNYDALLNHLRGEGLQVASAERGKAVFAKAECSKCHRFGELGESMGPELSTVGKRFLTKEILDSMIHPSLVISDQYAAKTVVTVDGLTYTGIVGSGGNGDLLVLQSDGQKVRVAEKDVEEQLPSPVSAMPEGLLNSLSLDEVADLMAFLKSSPVEKLTQKRTP